MNNVVIAVYYKGERRRGHAIGYKDQQKAADVYEATVLVARARVHCGEMPEGNIIYLIQNGKVARKEVI